MSELDTPVRPASELPALLRAMPGPGEQSQNGAQDEPKLPLIDAGDRNLPRISKAAAEALVAANDPPKLFWYGGMLARLDRDDDDVPTLRQLSEDRCRHALARSARFIRYDRHKHIHDALPPAYVVKDILASPSLEFPTLTRIVEVPVYAIDGTLNETPGYSETAKTYYAPRDQFELPPIPQHPTPEQIASVRQFIVDDLLGGFPFVGPAELANAVALLLDPFVRDMIAGPTPLRIIDAPSPGSGKSLLASVLLSPAIGREPAVMMAPKDEDEWRKRLFAALKSSPSSILIDNLTGQLSSGTLAGILTATYFEDRVLGLSETVRIPIRCSWVATSNNATLSTDHARRSVRIRLDPKIDKPWMRTNFPHPDLRAWAHEQRVNLVWSALVMVRHWINEGMPLGTVTIGSYERWAAVLGGILGSLEIPGFLENLEELYETADTEGAVQREFVLAWFEKYAETEVGAGDLFEVAGSVEGFDFGRGNDRSQRTRFGSQLVKMRDRVVEGHRITYVRTVNRAKKWRLKQANSDSATHEPHSEVHSLDLFQEDVDL